jgi:dTMP kinase
VQLTKGINKLENKPIPTKVEGGLLFMVDGIDGVGKSTQIEELYRRLISEGADVETARIPGGTVIGEALRDVMLSDIPRSGLTDVYIVMAMYAELSTIVKKWRNENKIILVDRSPMSIIAYQGFAEKTNLILVRQLFSRAMELLEPNQVLIYDLPAEIALSRDVINKQKKDYYTQNGSDFFERTREGYKYAAKEFPKNVCLKDIKHKSVNEVAELTYLMLRHAIT